MALSKILTMLSWAPVAVVASDFVGTFHWTTTNDMYPAVEPNRLYFVRRCRHLPMLKHGEVLALATPDGGQTVLRRLIGLPGDYVRSRKAHNNHAPADSMRFIPPGFVWVETDNPSKSLSSTVYSDTPVPVAMIRGRVTHTVPALQPITIEPSDRAFPSNNRQLYAPPRPARSG